MRLIVDGQEVALSDADITAITGKVTTGLTNFARTYCDSNPQARGHLRIGIEANVFTVVNTTTNETVYTIPLTQIESVIMDYHISFAGWDTRLF